MKRSKKGFTLAELLIVVAIIAVLVAISIPVFSGQLENSRNAVDEANIRSAYATAATELATNGEAKATEVELESTKEFTATIAGEDLTIKAPGTATVNCDSDGTINVTYSSATKTETEN